MSAQVRLELSLNTNQVHAVQSAARGMLAGWVNWALAQPSVAGGRDLETLRIGAYEYRVLAAGDWELGRLHDYINEQQGQGWQVDSAFGIEEDEGEAGAAALQVWLKRERRALRRAS